MATTSTNKQPLLVDRVFHEIANTSAFLNASDIDVSPTNSAKLLLNCIGTDGAVVEYVYAISRSTVTTYTANLYLSTSNDYLRPTEAFFIGSVTSTQVMKELTEMDLPKTLTPVPNNGSDLKNTALYVPANKALWVARATGEPDATDGPLVGIQGGYF